MRKAILGVSAALFFFVNNSVFAAETHKFVGVKKCSMCHKSEAKGNQYGQWLASKHSKAYETLASPGAQEAAKKAGITENPQESAVCLECHTTGYDADSGLLGEGFIKAEGVQCEACHGAGGDYLSLSVMKDKAKAIGAGLIIPTKELCLKCHNSKSPTYKDFNFNEYYPEVAHPAPK